MISGFAAVSLAALTIALGAASGARAQDGRPETVECLTMAETRAAVRAHEAIDLQVVQAAIQRATGAEVLRARLCRIDGRLTYTLTLLHRNGQVGAVLVDATSGTAGEEVPLPAPRLDRPRAAPQTRG